MILLVDTAASLLDTNVISVARSSKLSVPSVRKVTLDHLKKSIPTSKVTRVAQDRHEVCNRHMHCAHTLDARAHTRACTHTHKTHTQNTHTDTHRYTHTHNTHTHTDTHTHIQHTTHTHTHVHARTHMHTHTHTRTHCRIIQY